MASSAITVPGGAITKGATNTNTITFDVSVLGRDTVPRMFIVTHAGWNNTTMKFSLGMYRLAGTNETNAQIVYTTYSSSEISASITAEGVLSVTTTTNVSYVNLYILPFHL